jgi:transcriptional regulator with XRE-family HTH domain
VLNRPSKPRIKECGRAAGGTRRLKKAREEMGISQGQLAARSGVSRPMVSHTESGNRNPTLIVAHALATAMGLQMENLLGTVREEDEI